jgi:predicted DNA-binding protein YlxM (UPF0122 family)
MAARKWTDDDLLTILWLFDVEKWTGEEIATYYNTTRAAILGLIGRINRDLEKVDKTKRLNVIRQRRRS